MLTFEFIGFDLIEIYIYTLKRAQEKSKTPN